MSNNSLGVPNITLAILGNYYISVSVHVIRLHVSGRLMYLKCALGVPKCV